MLRDVVPRWNVQQAHNAPGVSTGQYGRRDRSGYPPTASARCSSILRQALAYEARPKGAFTDKLEAQLRVAALDAVGPTILLHNPWMAAY